MSSSTNATMSSTHLFFCINTNCENTSASGQQCVDCAEWAEACAEQADCSIALPPPVTHCEDCGAWSQVFPDNCCHTCHMQRVRSAPCEGCPGCGREMWGALLGTNGYCGPCWQQRYGVLSCCTCDGSGLVCPSCNEEYHENCRGCGAFTNLGLGDYCSSCYLPPLPPSPPPPTPRHTSLESMRAEIAEIEARLLTKMTKGQKDDWVWILQNRRADLAEAEKEMWEQYDQDDLNKLDRRY
jgi:hypothetical protein